MLNRIARCSLVVLASTVILGAGSNAFAEDKPVSFGIQGNWSEDADFGVGARAVVDLGKHIEGLEAVASFDYYFPSTGDADDYGIDVDVKYFEANLNGVYKFKMSDSSITPYVGAGLNIAHAKGGVGLDLGEYGDFDFEASATEMGLNILGGVLFDNRFFAEAKFEAGGGEQFVVTGGIRF